VCSYWPSAIRGFLARPEFELREAFTRRVHGKECVVGLSGSIPVACIKIGPPRRSSYLSRVFSRRARSRKRAAVRSGDANLTSPLLPSVGGDS